MFICGQYSFTTLRLGTHLESASSFGNYEREESGFPQMEKHPELRSWVESGNDPECGFPIQNLPSAEVRELGCLS